MNLILAKQHVFMSQLANLFSPRFKSTTEIASERTKNFPFHFQISHPLASVHSGSRIKIAERKTFFSRAWSHITRKPHSLTFSCGIENAKEKELHCTDDGSISKEFISTQRNIWWSLRQIIIIFWLRALENVQKYFVVSERTSAAASPLRSTPHKSRLSLRPPLEHYEIILLN